MLIQPCTADQRTIRPMTSRMAQPDHDPSGAAPTTEAGTPGGVRAVDAAYQRCAASLYRYLLVRVGHDPHLAQDLLQQLFVAARRNALSVPADELEFWFRAVARNLLNTHFRRLHTRPGDTPGPALGAELADRLDREPLPASMLERAEVRTALMLAITELNADDQDLLVAHYIHGRSQADLGERFSLSARAVEGRLYRARSALRARLKHLGDDPPSAVHSA